MKNTEQVIFQHDDKSKLVRTMQYTKKDYSALARCLNSYKDADSWPGGFEGNIEFTAESVENENKSYDFSSYFIAVSPEDDSKIVGTCFVAPSWNLHDSHYVELLGVDPQYQGQKLGKAMLLQATKYATEKNHRLIGLDTWAGNTNAMPLYKRQGYKWRVNTAVYMENYIPQILNHPLLRQKFTQFYWYEAYKPIVDQDPNLEWYDYIFEFPDDSFLQIWVDKTIGKINGYHIKQNDTDILMKLSVDKSEAFIGLEEFVIDFKIKNQGKHKSCFTVDFSGTSDFVLLDNSQITIELDVNEEKMHSFHAKFPKTTNPIDMKAEPEIFSKHMITAMITDGSLKYPLTIGKVPINPLTIGPKPANLTSRSGISTQLPIEFKNNTGTEIPVHVTLDNGKFVTLDTNEFDLTVAPMDSQLVIPISIKKTKSGVDTLRLRVSNKNNIEFIDQNISIGLLHHDKAIYFQQGPQMFLENDYLSISAYIKCQPGANYLEINHKQTKNFHTGHSLNTGLPFHEWGSEFYKIDLEHKIFENKEGICLFSSALSQEKSGLKVTRKLFLSHTRPLYSISFTVENISKEVVDNIGIREFINDWPIIVPCQSVIFPFTSGSKRFEYKEFQGNIGKDPSNFKEGWRVLEYPTGIVGVIFNLKDPNLTSVSIQSMFPVIDFELPQLKAGQSFETSQIYYCLGSHWTEVRRLWNEIYGKSGCKLPSVDIGPMHSFGLQINSNIIAHGLIVDNNSSDVHIGIQSDKKSTYTGTACLNIFDEKKTFDINQKNPKAWNAKIELNPDKNLTSGMLTIDSGTRYFDVPIAIGTFDSSLKITSSVTKTDAGNEFHFDNGYLDFKACDSFRGQTYHLGLKGQKNLLHTFFPEIKPHLWYNRYYGGIKHMISPLRSFSEVEYSKLAFKGKEVTHGFWKGVEFTSAIIDFDPTIKGLQTRVEYLTLPNSPFLLVRQIIKNHSGINRKFHADISVSANISKTIEDQFWSPSHTSFDGIAHYHTQEYESHAFREIKWGDPTWTAFQAKNSQHLLGMVSVPSKFFDLVTPYCPNMNYFAINRRAAMIELKPDESFSYKTLLIVAESLDQIYPFSRTNLEDLFPQ